MDFDSAIPRFESWRPSQHFLFELYSCFRCEQDRAVAKKRHQEGSETKPAQSPDHG